MSSFSFQSFPPFWHPFSECIHVVGTPIYREKIHDTNHNVELSVTTCYTKWRIFTLKDDYKLISTQKLAHECL